MELEKKWQINFELFNALTLERKQAKKPVTESLDDVVSIKNW